MNRLFTINTRSMLRQSAAASAIMLAAIAGPAWAQAEPAAPAAPAPQEEEPQAAEPAVADIVVTGSRITRSGFTAPTPTTVVGLADIQKAAPANIADFVNQMPQVSGSSTTRTGNNNTSTGTNGLNTLNLRSLGSNR
ncbi:MAG TPA: TonB-dependent receptor, partial [Sphingobium sp.]|nr:TonB-dependent receptor [Sphingobium sp.]